MGPWPLVRGSRTQPFMITMSDGGKKRKKIPSWYLFIFSAYDTRQPKCGRFTKERNCLDHGSDHFVGPGSETFSWWKWVSNGWSQSNFVSVATFIYLYIYIIHHNNLLIYRIIYYTIWHTSLIFEYWIWDIQTLNLSYYMLLIYQ